MNTPNLRIFHCKNKSCGNLSTTAKSTSSSLVNQTRFQNSSTTGLNLVNWQFTCLQIQIVLQTRNFKFLQTQSKHWFHLLRIQLLQRSHHKIFHRHFLTKIRWYLRLISPKSINLNNNPWPDQADYHNHTNTT